MAEGGAGGGKREKRRKKCSLGVNNCNWTGESAILMSMDGNAV